MKTKFMWSGLLGFGVAVFWCQVNLPVDPPVHKNMIGWPDTVSEQNKAELCNLLGQMTWVQDNFVLFSRARGTHPSVNGTLVWWGHHDGKWYLKQIPPLHHALDKHRPTNQPAGVGQRIDGNGKPY